MIAGLVSVAQDVNRTIIDTYDPHKNKIIPDKVFEIGLPLLAIVFLVNSLVTILKNRTESRLKEKALDKNLSEATLIALFQQDASGKKENYLKWFLLLFFLSLSFISVHFLAQIPSFRSGYLSVGVITLFLSIAFFIYYRIMRRN